MISHPLIPIIYARVIIAAANQSAADTKRLMAGTRINNHTLKEHSAGVTVDDYRRLLHNVKTVTGNPAMLLDAGATVPITAHGVVGIAFASSPNRMAVLDLMMRFVKLRSFFCSVRIEKSGEKTHCHLDIDPSLAEEKDTALDFILAVLMSSLMLPTLLPLSAPTIQLTRAKPVEHAYYEKLLGATISYDQSQDSITFDTAELELPTPFHDPEQFEIAVRKCRMLFMDEVSLNSTREAVELSFEKSPGMLWTLEQIAGGLHISPRTLQRRLKIEEANYQQVMDDWLMVMAAKYMDAEKLSVEATATLLGYTDEANFRRAFKRWHGCSPQVYRKKLAGSLRRFSIRI